MEQWYVDNQSLRTLAWNIEAVPAGTGIPPVRGDNLTVPFRHGARSHVKYYGERKFALSMFVAGCTPNGGLPDHHDSLATLYDNLDTLRQLFGRRDSLLSLRRVLPDGSERAAEAEVVGVLDFDSVKGAVARFTVDMIMPDPFWYGPQTIQRACWGPPRYGMYTAWGGDTYGGAALGYDLFYWKYGEGHLYGTPWSAPQVFTVAHPGTFATSNMVFHIHGICQNPRITHSNGTYVEVLTTMAKDDVLVIDCENFTAEKNGSSVIGSLRHAGDPAFMVLLPGTNLLTLTSDVTPAAAFSVIYNPRYL